LAGWELRAPKLKPKEAWTDEGLWLSAFACLRISKIVLPSTAHALLSMFAAIYELVSTGPKSRIMEQQDIPTGAITMSVVAIVGVGVVSSRNRVDVVRQTR
jgi:hypothetical protein